MENRRFGILVFFMLVAATAAMSFMKLSSPVKGSVTPSDAALRAFLFSTSDTLNTDINQGNFEFKNVKPGHYTIMIEGKPPYRNATREGVVVVDGQPTDVGDITMRQ